MKDVLPISLGTNLFPTHPPLYPKQAHGPMATDPLQPCSKKAGRPTASSRWRETHMTADARGTLVKEAG